MWDDILIRQHGEQTVSKVSPLSFQARVGQAIKIKGDVHMRLDINDKYCITSDERQFIVNQKGVAGEEAKKPGEPTLRPVGYFSTVSQCLTFLVNKQVRDSDCKSFKEVVSLIDKLNEEIHKFVKF